MTPLVLALATALASARPPDTPVTDTTIAVARGDQLGVNVMSGELAIRTWGRDVVQVRSPDGDRVAIEVARNGSTVAVRTSGRRGPPRFASVEITIPSWMDVSATGVALDVTVDGARGAVRVETVNGDVTLTGGDGVVSLRSVEGDVTVERARGRVSASSVNADVTVRATAGEISAETVNGSITLDQVDAGSVSASTVNGDIAFSGPLKDGGRYDFSTHNGDLTLAVPANASAQVSVATFGGEFESDFPVTLTETRRGRRFTFSIGTGRAQVTLESFQGTIRLRRP